mgnify:CR=1 FL=1
MKLKNGNIHLIDLKRVLTKIRFITIELLLYLRQNRLKMKKTLLLLSIIALIFSCEKEEPLAPNTYEITVSAKGIVNGLRSYIKIVDGTRKEILIDTAIVMNEVYTFRGEIKGSAIRVMTINSVKGMLPFVLEPGRTTIEIYKDSIYYSKVGGTKNNEDYNLFKNELKKIDETIRELRHKIKDDNGNNPELVAELRIKNRIKTDESIEYLHTFISEHPNSDFSLLILESYINRPKQNFDKLKESFGLLTGVVNKNTSNKLIGQKIETFINLKEAQANLDIGKVAPNFTAPKADGELLSLNDIKGKATIIDFWASWCKPCRVENPNVVRVYEKYHEKGLEIISVSLDRNGQKERWLKAIEDDNMNWHHVSSLKFWNEPVAKMYNVSAIPATFILDENGVIVAKKLRGQALEDQIASMLD